MAQTTGALSWSDVHIQLSNDNFSANDVDIDGWSNSVKVSSGERAVSEFFTSDGDTPIVTYGKRSALEITVQIVYTEGATEAFEVCRAAYEAATKIYLKWSPKGGSPTNFSYLTTGGGYLTKPPYPQGAADSADALSFELVLKCPKITKSVLA